MKIGEYEVEVLSNEKVKVGCQEVTKGEVQALLEKMADYSPKLTPSTMPIYVLAIGVSGELKGELFARAPESVIRIHPMNKTGYGGWNDLNSSYDNTTVRVLTAEEIGRITKGDGK